MSETKLNSAIISLAQERADKERYNILICKDPRQQIRFYRESAKYLGFPDELTPFGTKVLKKVAPRKV